MLRGRDVHNVTACPIMQGSPPGFLKKPGGDTPETALFSGFINSSMTHRLTCVAPCPAAYQRRGCGCAGGCAGGRVESWRKSLPGMAANGDVSRR